MLSRAHRPLNKRALKSAVDAALASQGRQDLTAALIEATRAKDLAAMRLLLRAGADPNEVVDGTPALGWTAATYSPRKGGREAVQLLLDAGADPRFPGLCGLVPPEAVKLLVDAGADPSRFGDGSGTVAWSLWLYVNRPTTALALLQAGADPNIPDARGTPALIHAVDAGSSKVIDALLEHGADPLAVDPTGRSALRRAVEGLCGGTPASDSQRPALRAMVRRLSRGLPAQPEDVVLATLALDDAKSLESFLNSGLPADARVKGGIGLLGFATADQVRAPDAPMLLGIPLLLPDQSQVDLVVGGCSLLGWAVRLDAIQCAAALLRAGADPNARNAAGVSAADLAVGRGTSFRMQKLLGTEEIAPRDHVPGTRKFAADFQTEECFQAPMKRTDRLAVNAACYEQQWTSWLQDIKTVPERVNGLPFCGYLWHFLCLAYVLEQESHIPPQAARMKASARSVLATGWCPEDGSWTDDFPSALAVAMLTGDWESAAAFAAALHDSLPRNAPGDSMYNQPYFAWPLLLLWSQALRDLPLDAALLQDLRRQSPRYAKRFHLLLDALLAIHARDVKRSRKSFSAYVVYHRKTERTGQGRGDGACYLPCPYATILALWAPHRGIDLALTDHQKDLVILPPTPK